MWGVLCFNFLSCIWQVRTLLPTVPINHSKCLLTLGNMLSFGAQRYSKMLHLRVFLMQHMVGGCWKLSCAFCFIGLQLWLGMPWLRYPKDPPQRTALLGHGNKDRIKSQPKFFQVKMVLPWGGQGAFPSGIPLSLPSPSPTAARSLVLVHPSPSQLVLPGLGTFAHPRDVEMVPAPRLVCCWRNKETAASTVI